MQVRIKETNEILLVKKRHGSVLTCYIKEPYYFDYNILVDVMIIGIDKVEILNEQSNQLTLF